MGNFKLVQLFEGNTVELYNLKNEPGETTNLATREAEKTQQLIDTFKTWQRETDAPLVTKANPAFDPSAQPKRDHENRGKGTKSKSSTT